jgi:hypothetical protein
MSAVDCGPELHTISDPKLRRLDDGENVDGRRVNVICVSNGADAAGEGVGAVDGAGALEDGAPEGIDAEEASGF